MIIAIIFLFLSLFVIVFTVIYLSKQNKIKRNIMKRKGKRNIKNIWEIDDIKERIIISGNKNTIIMRIGSIDYHLLSEKEQNVLEINLIEIAKTIKYPLQFFSTTEFVDTSEIINEIKKNIENKDNRKIVYYGNEIIKHLSKMMENRNMYIRKNYVVISCIGAFDKAKIELQNIYDTLRFNLMNSKIGLDILDDFEIVELLHREFNKNTTTKIENLIEKGGLELYVKGIKEEYKGQKGNQSQKFI